MTSCQETEEEPRFCNVAVRRPPGYRAKMAAPIDLHLEFGGGAELLFGGVKMGRKIVFVTSNGIMVCAN
ncbi:UNVERIFIED_CONTAM: hypothetical protein FKN15_007069 [Acipenser sinensis]